MLERGKKLIGTNAKYAVQEVVNGAREGNKTSLDYLALFNLDTKDFDKMSDSNIRKHIFKKIEQDDEPQTTLDKIESIPSQARGGRRKVKDKFSGLRKKMGNRYA